MGWNEMGVRTMYDYHRRELRFFLGGIGEGGRGGDLHSIMYGLEMTIGGKGG